MFYSDTASLAEVCNDQDLTLNEPLTKRQKNDLLNLSVEANIEGKFVFNHLLSFFKFNYDLQMSYLKIRMNHTMMIF